MSIYFSEEYREFSTREKEAFLIETSPLWFLCIFLLLSIGVIVRSIMLGIYC
jgi:hypothetical protein